MTLFECRRFRVEINQCRVCGEYSITITLIEYLGKEDFKQWLRLCKRNFMVLVNTKPWRFELHLQNYDDALRFTKTMVQQLGEVTFFNRVKSRVEIVTPKDIVPMNVDEESAEIFKRLMDGKK